MPQHRPIPFQLTTGAERGRISLYGKVRRQTASGARVVSADLGAGFSTRLETVVAQLLPGRIDPAATHRLAEQVRVEEV